MKTMNKTIQSLRAAMPRKATQRLVAALLLGAMLACLLTSCGGGGNQAVATVSKGEIKEPVKTTISNGMTEAELTELLTGIDALGEENATALRDELNAALAGENAVEGVKSALAAKGVTLTEEQASKLTPADGFILANGFGESLGKEALGDIADAIVAYNHKDSKTNANDLREWLVASLRGYDMTAAGFSEDNLGTPDTAKSLEYAKNALKLAKERGLEISPEQLEKITLGDVQTLVNCFKSTVDMNAELNTLDTVLHWIGIGFGFLIEPLGFGSFIMGTLYFAIILEILMLPMSIFQQKNSRKQAKLRPREQAIRNKYKGRTDQATQQKMTQEIQELYTSEGYSPMSGCLPMLISMPFLIFLYYIVIDPMKYIVGATTELSNAFLTFATASQAAGGLGLAVEVGGRGSIEVLAQVRDLVEALAESTPAESVIASLADFQFFTNGGEVLAKLADLDLLNKIPDFTLFGINMGYKPAFDFSDWRRAVLLLMPVVTFLVYWGSGKITRKFTFQPMQQAQEGENKDPAQGCSNGMMNIMMPAMSAWFTFMVPAAVGLYWMIKSVISTVKTIVVAKVMPLPTFTEEDYKAAERELMGKEPKKAEKTEKRAGNPNVRSLHHIDDEDYETPAEREARLAARKRDYVEPEETAKPEKPKTAEGAFGGGATLKEDRPAEEKGKKKPFWQKNKDE